MELKKLDKTFTTKEFLKQNWMLIAAIVYLVFPLDFLPDVVPLLGLGDDILILLGTLLIRYAKLKKQKD